MKILQSRPQKVCIGVKIPKNFLPRNAVIRGLMRYMESKNLNWYLDIEEAASEEVEEVLIGENWKGDGLVLFRGDPGVDPAVPSVNISTECESARGSRVLVDNVGAGRLAAQHLLSLGIMDFVYVGRDGRRYSQQRLEGFTQVLKERHHKATVFELHEGLQIEELKARLDAMIHSLAQGSGIFVVDDSMAKALLMSCRRQERLVPEELAVISFIGERLTARTMNPGLSSVMYPGEEVGYAAARNLHLELDGKRNMVERCKLIGVTSIEARESTNHIASADPRVVRAIQWIRSEAGGRALTVNEVCERSGLGSSSLKFHFARTLGHSPKVEISKVRLGVMQDYLMKSNYSVGNIAELMGFSAAEEASRFFKKMTGHSPSQFRALNRS